jgi:hypothetical protein
MPFSKPLPEWNNLGTKPPQSKIDTGWLPDDKPPADWWNWFQYTTHQALLEVHQNAVHTDRAGQTIAQLVSGKVPVAQLPDGTTSAKGILQLTSATNSTSTVLAATASSVKTTYDLANGKYTKPSSGIPKADLDAAVQASLGSADTAEANAIAHADQAVSNVQTDLNNHKGSGGTAHANATQMASGFQSAADKTKLDGIATGAEVNQNTFANVKVGTTTIASDSKSDTLELAAGTNIVLTPDATNDKVTIALSPEVETVTGSQAKATAVQNNLNTHTSDTANPHAVTASQVGAYNKTEADANFAPKNHVGASGTAHPAATTLAAGFMSTSDKSKLDGIAAGANNYSHPANHPPSIITQDASNRFVTDTEKNNWNAKASTAVATTSANGLMSSGDKTKLDGVATGANNYTHPANHPPSIITQDANNRFVTDTEKTNWNSKETPANALLKVEHDSYKTSKTNKDANGIFTTVEHRRKSDNTLVRRSVLSGGTSPNYTTRTVTFYAANGTTVTRTDTFTLTYDSDGVLISEV